MNEREAIPADDHDQPTDQPQDTQPQAEPAEQKAPEKPQKPSALPSVRSDEGGVLVGSTLEEQARLARYYYESKLFSKTFDSPARVLTGMQLAYELGFKPVVAMNKMCIINGVITIHSELPLAAVRMSGLLTYFKETRFAADGVDIPEEDFMTPVFGWRCESERKGGERIVRAFTKHDAEVAGLMKKDTYKNYLSRMLQMRARTWNLRDNFGDVLMGAPIAEYDFHVNPASMKNVREINTEHEGRNEFTRMIEDLE